MKINNIKLKNIHSLKGLHEVDFANGPLAQTGLFAIIGPTGSGKSTLLDAITLALFNSTPRSGSLSRAAIEKTGAIITRNTNDAFCEAEYESFGKTLRSRWEISRARTGKLRDYHMTLAVKDEMGIFNLLDVKKGDIPEKNTEFTGLSYDQFIKSMLLSQGEFARFLKSPPKERSALLEKITGTEIYRNIGKRAFEKQKEEKAALDKLLEKQGDIALLNEEELAKLKSEIEALKQKVEEGRQKLKLLTEKINIKNQIAEKITDTKRIKAHLELLQNDRKEMLPAANRLALHKMLLPLKSDIDTIALHEKRATILNREADKSGDLSQKLLIELNAANETLLLKKAYLENRNTEYLKLQPAISEAKKLDQEIKIEQSAKTQVIKMKQQNLHELESVKNSLLQNSEDLKLIYQKIIRIDKFLDENPELNTLGDELPGVISRNNMLNVNLKSLTLKIKAEFPQLAKNLTTALGLTQVLANIQKTAQAIAHEQETLVATFGNNIPDQQKILDNIDSNTSLLQVFSELLRLVQQVQKKINEKLESNIKSTELKKQLEELVLSGQQTTHSIEISDSHIEELRARKQRQALEAKYDDARRLLEPEKPCPLCGATQHPFVVSYTNNLDQTTQKLEEERKQNEKLKNAFKKITEESYQIKTSISNLDNNIARLEKELDKTNEEIKIQLQKTAKKPDDLSIPNITELLEETNLKLRNLKQSLSTLSKIKTLDERHTKVWGLIETTQELVKFNSDLQESMIPFKKHLGKTPDTDAKIELLKSRLSVFRQANTHKTEFREKQATTASAISEKEKQIQALEARHAQIVANNTKIEKLIEQLIEKRVLLFGDKNPDLEDKSWNDQLQKAQKEIAELEKQKAIKKEKTNHLENEIIRIKTELEETRQESRHLQEKISPDLRLLKLNSFTDASEALLGTEEAAAIQQKLDELKSAIDKAGQSIEDLEKNLSSLSLKDDNTETRDFLENSKQELQETNSSFDREIGNKAAYIKSDKENRSKYAGIHDAIQKQEKEFSRWEALNNLIGDATGSRFSRFAQQLTLIQMLTAANKHLKKLSNRYLIINENSGDEDGLFVIDTYHGDEQRSVKTLSGGESFLVSLALALGLSDLAGNKTKINSLFIDEGFGSLDQQTLDIALSTLERLQHETNRTIGVISHVEALKERITTQIELTRDAFGNSALKINS